jgi:hypothetical protein
MNAYNLAALPALGVNVSKLGCVMLDVEPADPDLRIDFIKEEWGYHSTHPDRRYVSGVQYRWHVTLLYGLLHNAQDIKEHVDEALRGWAVTRPLTVRRLEMFPSPWESEPYVSIVGRLSTAIGPEPPDLIEAHARLSMLPHIDTHPQYKPHVNFGFVKRHHATEAYEACHALLPMPLTVVDINYGGEFM